MENKIIEIEIDKLFPHPNNPRKNVGDVSELAESIKKSGVLQNLTVVRRINCLTGEVTDGEYTVIIGHRRKEAAFLAGVKKLPCVIKEMSPTEQIATMLAENVQRNELTPLEQAEGIQMMFDMGESVSDVVTKTGLSESTVRRRAKLLDMDRETLRATEGRGASLADYEKLSQIDDIEVRNKVLENIGTNNFNMDLNNALREQQKKKNKQKLFELLDTFAEKVTSYPSMTSYIKSWSYDEENISVNIPEDADTEEYLYYPNSYSVVLYKKVKKVERKLSEEEKAEAEERAKAYEKEEERKQKLIELAKSAYELRKKFVLEFSPAPKDIKNIKRFLWNMVCFVGYDVDRIQIDNLLGSNFNDIDTYQELSDEVDRLFDEGPDKMMLYAAYLLSGDCEDSYICRWRGEWEEDENAERLYDCLEMLGYKISDEENKLRDGSHELFEKVN